ncbi:ORC3 [Sanghuangporus weigelae]
MEAETSKLESVTETVIDIPFGGSDSESDFEDEDVEDEDVPGDSFPCRMHTPPELIRRDIPNGALLRMKVYRDAFDRCRSRAMEVLRWLHRPVVKRILDVVQGAYEVCEEDRLMPYTELRTVAIAGYDRSATSYVLEDARRLLAKSVSTDDEANQNTDKNELRFNTPVVVSILTPTDCSNLTSAMKTIIGGFLASGAESEDHEDGRARRKLASYDINLLETWYDALRESREETDLPKLVILVHDFEKIEPGIMQDIFYICRLHVPRLPFVFILGLATPPTPSYLHAAFPRRTLALLRLTRVEVAGGMDVLKHVLCETFFDPVFEPTIMPSPAVLSFIIQQFARKAQSMDFVLSLLQLVHLRHFTDPLSVLAHDELLGTGSIEDAAKMLSEPSGRPFLLALLARLHRFEDASTAKSSRSDGINDCNGSSETERLERTRRGKGKQRASGVNEKHDNDNVALNALKCVRELRQEHKERLRKSRMAFHVVRELRKCLLEDRRIDGDSRRVHGIGTELDLMCSWLRGTIPDKEGKVLVKGLRGSASVAYKNLARDVKDVLSECPEEVIPKDDNGTSFLDLFDDWINRLNIDSNSDTAASNAMDEMNKWLVSYISESTRDFTETKLWDIWYTGNPTGIEELINPAPRAAIINALVHPERYLGYTNTSLSNPSSPEKGKGKQRADNVPHGADGGDLAPDTAILFKGYLESGRMVNVYDWYMSFKESLDGRRRSEKAAEEKSLARTRGKNDRQKAVKRLEPRDKERSVSPSPTRGRGRRRGRGRGSGRGGRGGKYAERLNAAPESDDGGDESETGDENDLSPEEREIWESEVHTRFIRSIQELDLLGFIKHTGRKADHVQKSVYDLPDYI